MGKYKSVTPLSSKKEQKKKIVLPFTLRKREIIFLIHPLSKKKKRELSSLIPGKKILSSYLPKKKGVEKQT